MFPVMKVIPAKNAATIQYIASKVVEIGKRMSTKPSDYYGKRLRGKVALTVASTDGIGFAIAQRYAVEGANVVVSSRKSENVERAVKALKEEGYDVLGVTCHVSDEKDRQKLVDATIDAYGGIDIFMYNAGVNPIALPLRHLYAGGVLDCSEEAWDKIFEVNLKNTWQMTKLVVPHLKKRETASIIYISSLAAFNLSHPMVHTYSMSKLALLGLTKGLTIELADDNIRVNSICPGPTSTKFIEKIFELGEEYKNGTINVPLFKRLGEPDEVSGLAAFLSSDDGKFVTGENIVVAGGAHSRI